MTGQTATLVADQAKLTMMQQVLGAHLATYRQAAGVTQPQLGAALGRTRTAISKIEHGARGMPAGLWKIADDVCLADGAFAHNRFNPNFAVGYAGCQIRLGHALILDKDITEATRILGQAAIQAHLSPRLTAELHTTRTILQPWANTPAVTALDTRLHACGLMSNQKG